MDRIDYVTKLKEYFDQQQIIVKYVHVDTSQLKFNIFAVINGKSYGIGEGNSKQEAKNQAAKKALEEITGCNMDNDKISSNVRNVVSSPIQSNAVGALQEYCMANNLNLPEYSVTHLSGPPHFPIFTTVCKVGKQTVSADAPTKKNGKQEAANKMFTLLKKENVNNEATVDVKLNICKYYSDEEFMKKTTEAILQFERTTITAKKNSNKKENNQTSFKKYIEENNGVNLSQINFNYVINDHYYNGEKTVSNMTELFKKLKLRFVLEVKRSNPYIVWVIFEGEKKHCCAGMGDTQRAAEYELVEEVMLFFRLML